MGTDTFAVCLVATKLPSPRTSKVGLGKKGKYIGELGSLRNNMNSEFICYSTEQEYVWLREKVLRLHQPRTIGHEPL